MTDKIIINGVDVSGCRFCVRGICRPWITYYLIPCENQPNCYYKQLARKTEECEKLKQENKLLQDCANCKVDEYKQTIEEIKEFCIVYSDNHDCYEAVYKTILRMCEVLKDE